MNRTITTILALVLLVALFFGINILAGQGLRSARIDLTENKLFTLAEGSRRIARSAEEPIRLTYYWSQSITRKSPGLQQWGQRVRELLEEFQRQSGGKIKLEIVDPEPFSDAEDQAKLAGLVESIRASGEDPGQYIEISFSVSERAYGAWPDAIRHAFEPARTVRTGKPSFRLISGEVA